MCVISIFSIWWFLFIFFIKWQHWCKVLCLINCNHKNKNFSIFLMERPYYTLKENFREAKKSPNFGNKLPRMTPLETFARFNFRERSFMTFFAIINFREWPRFWIFYHYNFIWNLFVCLLILRRRETDYRD